MNREKAKELAKHYGCQALITAVSGHCPDEEWCGINYSVKIDGEVLMFVENGFIDVDPNLVALSAITDDDCIEVASIYHPDITWSFANRSRTFVELEGHDGQEFTLFYSLSVMSEDSSFDSILPGGDMKAHAKAIEFLRSKGYNL